MVSTWEGRRRSRNPPRLGSKMQGNCKQTRHPLARRGMDTTTADYRLVREKCSADASTIQVEKTPSCVDWKLVHRDPLPTWITEKARMCLLGDAAHPFLPTSIQGCSMAVEDSCALATCLAMSHADAAVSKTAKVPTALRTYQRLRFERVKEAQKKGEQVRDMWHKADWAKVRKNPSIIKLPREDWLLQHDCERFVRRLWSLASVEGTTLERKWLACGPESDEFECLERENPQQHHRQTATANVCPPTPPAEEAHKRLQ